jgi:Peptidase family M28
VGGSYPWRVEYDHDVRAAAAETIELLAGIDRLPTSDGERRAAGLIRDWFAARGCKARVEEVPAYRSYAKPIGILCAAAAAAGLLAGRGAGRGWRKFVGPTVGALVGAAASCGIADDITGGRMLARRVLMRRRCTTNVIAEAGEPDAARTLVVLVHHDAAPSGVVFGQYLERWLVGRHPEIVESLTSNPPLWWPVIAGPALISLGSVARLGRLAGRDSLRWLGVGLSAMSAAALADIASRPAVPGANDNLSGVAVALELAAAVRASPIAGLRLLFVSAGAEEALQQGVMEFARAHFGGLDPELTWFLTLDTVGSGHLVMLEGEGPVRMHDYDASFKNQVAECARQAGIPLIRGLRSRNSTDGCVPHRHGFATVTLVSVDDRKMLPNYHLYSDTPANVDYRSVEDAVRLTEAVARHLTAR